MDASHVFRALPRFHENRRNVARVQWPRIHPPHPRPQDESHNSHLDLLSLILLFEKGKPRPEYSTLLWLFGNRVPQPLWLLLLQPALIETIL